MNLARVRLSPISCGIASGSSSRPRVRLQRSRAGARCLSDDSYTLSEDHSRAAAILTPEKARQGKHPKRRVNDAAQPFNPRKSGQKHFSIPPVEAPAVAQAMTYSSHVLPASENALCARETIVNRVNAALRRNFGHGYFAKPFGSTTYGVSSSDSDLDLIIYDTARPNGIIPGEMHDLPPIYDLKKLSRCLFKAGFHIDDISRKAVIPIIQFTDRNSKIKCDINVNERLGRVNSELIHGYCQQAPVLKSVLKVVKFWAKQLGLNNPAPTSREPRTFSSYAFALMTIGVFLRHHRVENPTWGTVPRSLNPLVEGIQWHHLPLGPIRCQIKYSFPTQDAIPNEPTEVEVLEALREWFRYWATEHDYDGSAVDIRLGGIVPRINPWGVDARPRNWYPLEGAAEQVLPGDPPMPEGAKQEVVVADKPAELDEGDTRFGLKLTSSDSVPASKAPLPPRRAAEPEVKAISAGAIMGGNENYNSWSHGMLCVVDPFIRTKNCTVAIGHKEMISFRKSCVRAVELLEEATSVDDWLHRTFKSLAKKARILERVQADTKPVTDAGGDAS